MSTAAAAFLPPGDAFGRTASLVFDVELPVLGTPLRLRSNAARVIALGETMFGSWRGVPPSLIEVASAVGFDVIVMPRGEEPLPALAYRRHGPVFMAASSTAMVSVLLDAGRAVAFVPAQALEDEEWLTGNVLGLAWTLVSRRRRVPLHAAVVVGRARALLLMGDSGVGKSTLAYAASRAGLEVLTEDTVFVDVAPAAIDARLWGGLPCHWLAPDTAAVFPEVGAWPEVARANGKRRFRVPPLAPVPLLTTTAPVTAIAVVPGGGEPGLEPLGPDAIADRVQSDGTQGFDQYPETRPDVVAWLRTRPAYVCHRGRDPRATAMLLAALAALPPSEAPTSMRLPLATSIL